MKHLRYFENKDELIELGDVENDGDLLYVYMNVVFRYNPTEMYSERWYMFGSYEDMTEKQRQTTVNMIAYQNGNFTISKTLDETLKKIEKNLINMETKKYNI